MGWVAPSVPLPTCILTDTDCLPPYFMLVQTIKCMIVICVLCVCHTLVGQCYELNELYELTVVGLNIEHCTVVGSVCLSVRIQNLTYHPTNDTTYLTGNEGQNNCAVFSPLQS